MSDHKAYFRCGKEYRRVSNVLAALSKPALLFFYGKYGTKEAKAIADRAKAKGTQLHSYIDDYYAPEGTPSKFDSKALEGDLELVQAIKNFHAFERRYSPKPVLVEQTVYYDECTCYSESYVLELEEQCTGECYGQQHRYAGTFDGIFNIGGKNILLDWKTSSGLWDEYFMQIEAYKHAYESMVTSGNLPKVQIDGYWIIRFAKDEEFDPFKHIGRYIPNEATFNGFMGLIDALKGVEAIQEQQRKVKEVIKERKRSTKLTKVVKKRSIKNDTIN